MMTKHLLEQLTTVSQEFMDLKVLIDLMANYAASY
jgi:hypothetical protein